MRWVVWLGLGLTAGCWFPPPVVDAGDGDMDAGVDAGPEGPSIDTFTINSVNGTVELDAGMHTAAWSSTNATSCELTYPLETAADAGATEETVEIGTDGTTAFPVTAPGPVTLTCSDAAGVTAEATITVVRIPEVMSVVLYAGDNDDEVDDADVVNEGRELEAVVVADYALLCRITYNGAATGQDATTPSAATGVRLRPTATVGLEGDYAVVCSGAGATPSAAVPLELNVVRLASVSLNTANVVAPGDAFEVTWTGSGLDAGACQVLDSAGTGISMPGDATYGYSVASAPTGQFTIDLSCHDGFSPVIADAERGVEMAGMSVSVVDPGVVPYAQTYSLDLSVGGVSVCELFESTGMLVSGPTFSGDALNNVPGLTDDQGYYVRCASGDFGLTVQSAVFTVAVGPGNVAGSYALEVVPTPTGDIIATITHDGPVASCQVRDAGDGAVAGPLATSGGLLELTFTPTAAFETYYAYCQRATQDGASARFSIWGGPFGSSDVATVAGILAAMNPPPPLSLIAGNVELAAYAGGNIDPLDTVTAIGGYFNISNAGSMALLTSGGTPMALTTVHGGLTVSQNSLLQNLGGLQSLVTVDGAFTVNGNNSALFTTIADTTLTSLATVGGTFAVTNNSSVETIDIPTLTSTGPLTIADNPALTSLSLANLACVAGDIQIDGNTSLACASATSLVEGAALAIEGTDVDVSPNAEACSTTETGGETCN